MKVIKYGLEKYSNKLSASVCYRNLDILFALALALKPTNVFTALNTLFNLN